MLIFSDSQQALRIISEYPHLSKCLSPTLRSILDHASLQDFGDGLELHWVPGHAGISGNVLAYKMARRVSGYMSQAPYPRSCQKNETAMLPVPFDGPRPIV
ncbi:hypothetical protein BDV12DRAFT_162951 [Aspergillus spectabilis]